MLDAHIHIDFYDNPSRIIREIIKEDITAIFVTHLPELYEKQRIIIENIPQVLLAVGFHPILVNEYEFKKEIFINALKTTRFIGEVGLDYSVARSEKSRLKQQEIFNTICRYSNSHILSIHCRMAELDVMNILKEHKVENAIFHWYTGSKDMIPSILEEGYFFSANPSMLRTNKGKSILKEIPLNRLLIETDGPFTKYDDSIVHPALLKRIYLSFQEFYNVDNLEEIVLNNMMTMIR